MFTFISDWDGVLFNVAALKQDWFHLLDALSGKDAVATYETVKQECGFYDATYHMELLGGTERVWRQAITDFLREKAPQCIFPEARPLLEGVRARGGKVVIMTKGTNWFQRAKIDLSGLDSVIDAVYVAEDRDKIAAFREVSASFEEPRIFLEDTPEELEILKQHDPSLRTILLVRKGVSLTAPYIDAIVRHLGEVLLLLP